MNETYFVLSDRPASATSGGGETGNRLAPYLIRLTGSNPIAAYIIHINI